MKFLKVGAIAFVVLVVMCVLGYFVFSSVGVCDRTPEVRDAILRNLPEVDWCVLVTSEHLGTVRYIQLGNENMPAIKADDFDGLTNLTYLGLRDNNLVSFPDGVFDDLISLKTLQLDENDLASLPEGVFDNLVNLEKLELSNNDLVSLPPGVFDDLKNLEQLDISNNLLSSLPPGIFQNVLDLKTLDLTGNKFSCIPRDTFGSRTDEACISKYLLKGNITICNTSNTLDDYIGPNLDQHTGLDKSGNINRVTLTRSEQAESNLSLATNLIAAIKNLEFASPCRVSSSAGFRPESIYVAAYVQRDPNVFFNSKIVFIHTYVFNSDQVDTVLGEINQPAKGQYDLFRMLHKDNTFVEVGTSSREIDSAVLDELATKLSERLNMSVLERFWTKEVYSSWREKYNVTTN